MNRLLLLALVLAPAAGAQTLEGRITSGQSGVPFATVRVVDAAVGTAADVDGAYRFALPQPGTYIVAASAVGYAARTDTIVVGVGQTVRWDVALEPAAYETDAVVVTGTMEQIGVRESPVRIDVLPARFLQVVPTANVMDVLDRVNGLYEQIDCGVCVTNNIRINGIEGPNTAVLIDGMPVMSSLATVYGLNGISPMLISQVEVVKGPMSTLYGSEALGGVINIRTKDPSVTPGLTVNAFSTTHGEAVAEVAGVPLRGRTSLLVSGTVDYSGFFHDRNDDGFSDRPLQNRLSGFAKLTRSDARGMERASLVAQAYYEDRAAGVEPFLDDPDGLRGSSDVYGESIYTRRASLLGTWKPAQTLEVQASASAHAQDSYYGDTWYDAFQADAFAQALWRPRTAGAWAAHDLLAGLAVRAQRYDDASGATGLFTDDGELIENRPDDRIVPGVFVQNDWTASEHVRLLGGLRADYQRDYGPIFSPRAAAKFSPSRYTTARLNVGTGFRVVNLFTEDHAAYTGGRATVVLEDLEPERSVSVAGGVQQIVLGMGAPLTVDVDLFWTRFSNKIEPSYDTPGEIRYANLDGSATTRGVAAQLQGTLARDVRFTLGATLLDVFATEEGADRPLEFAPDYQGTATVTWQAPLGLVVDYSANLVGPMQLPDYASSTRAAYLAATGAPLRTRSPVYSVHNLQLTRDVLLPGGRLLQIYGAVNNALNYTQSSPLVGFYEGNPGFGETFDTAYVYGPIEGRHLGLGLRLTMP
jgi:outer membrane receptor for ferrienterochelin and colicins